MTTTGTTLIVEKEKICKDNRGLALNYKNIETLNKEMERLNNKYNEVMIIIEERNRRIEEKIDKQFREHQRQMDTILELLSNGLTKRKRRVRKEGKSQERLRNTSEEEEEDSVSYY